MNLPRLKVEICFTFIILLSLTYFEYVSGSKNHDGTCAVLYSGGNFAENELSLKQYQPISAFSEHHINSDDVWNTTGSLKIVKGCTFMACNESYFDGICKSFDADVAVIPPVFQNIGSANCSCETDCKCTDIRLRKTECARAYIEKGCDSCNAYYTDFRNKKPFIGDAFKTRISSIVVRPGCQLEVFDDEDYEGDSEIVEGINATWTRIINSYECTCTNDVDVDDPIPIRPDSYPPIIEVPDTPDAIMSLLDGTDRHAGLLNALQSIKNKRSPKHAYILLLGLTGAGKSSSINLLFDNPDITKVGDGGSVTSDIHEFRIPVPVDELGISNSELRVIDTPGLGDTRGLENDAKFLATLEDFLNSHEDLSKYIPNVVLIFAKFNDNRFQGDGASFVKMLRGIDLFRDRLTDKKFSNVVFVLSHYMSETKEMTRRPTKRLGAIKKTIEDFSLFPKPVSIVVAENKAQEEDLPMLNGYYKLPNGDFYPRNLFDKIQQLTTSGLDPIGEAVIRTAFKNSDNFNITPSTFSLVESKHGKVVKYLGILSAANFKVDDTEVSRALATAFETLSPELKRKFPDALPYLQRSFNIRNIHLKTNVPRTTVDIVKLLKEIRQNEANMYLMEKAFSLKMPELKENLVAGYGYNVIDDVTLPSTPFQFGPKTISDIGYLIPSVLTCKVENDIRNVYESFSSMEAYLNYRLQNLNVQGSVPVSSFKGVTKPGCNVIDLTNLTAAVDGHVFTAVREHRTYELVLNDKLDLTKEFIATVKSLPTYNESDYDGLEVWKKFFGQYGTHVVKSAHGGGSIEIQLKSMEPANPVIEQAMFSIVQFAEDVSIGRVSGLSLDTNGTQYALKFRGGDFKYHASTLSSMSLSDAAALLENWKESLALSPVMLHTDMKLLPISEVAKKVGHNISSEIQRAALALFNSTLRYVPPPKINLPPEAREDTERIQASSNNQLTEVLAQMMEESRKSSERFEKMMLEMNKEAKEREAQRERERAEERKWERERQARMDDARREDIEREKDRQFQLDKQREETKKEMEIARQDEQRRRKQEQLLQQQQQEEQRQQYMQMIQKIADKPPVVIERGGGGCLKKGTKIRGVDGAQILVENIKVGDIVLDKNLAPTRILSVSAWFLGQQKFYGFDNESQFFTQTHMFASKDRFHVVNKPYLLELNPLMAELDVQEFPNQKFNISTYDPVLGTVDKIVELSIEPTEYPPDTIVYFIQVDSETETYFANDFVCRHEVPPFDKWANTMATFFVAMEDPRVQFIKSSTYTVEHLATVEEIIVNLYVKIGNILQNIDESNSEYDESNSMEEVPFTNFDPQLTMARIFEKPTFAHLAIGIYANIGPLIAPVLDSSQDSPKLQSVLVEVIINEILIHKHNF